MNTVIQVTVLDVDPGFDTNRTVVTLVGSPEAIAEAAFKGIKRAVEILDMSQHSGTHPRMGATDVCPFIPVSSVSDDECIELSKQPIGCSSAPAISNISSTFTSSVRYFNDSSRNILLGKLLAAICGTGTKPSSLMRLDVFKVSL